MAYLDSKTICSDRGLNIPTGTGSFVYETNPPPGTTSPSFLVQSDTNGVVTGVGVDNVPLNAPVPAYGVTRVKFSSVNITTTRTGALASATLLAIPI
jgi:hypothetical protein